MAEHSRAWLERLLRACEGAAARLESRNDPTLKPLLDDIRALQARLQQQLEDPRSLNATVRHSYE